MTRAWALCASRRTEPGTKLGVERPAKAGTDGHCPMPGECRAGVWEAYQVDHELGSGSGSKATRGGLALRSRTGDSTPVASTARVEGRAVSRGTRKGTRMATWQSGLSHRWTSEPTLSRHADGDRRVRNDISTKGRLS